MSSQPVVPFPRRFIFHGNAVAAEVFLTRIGNVEKTVVNPVTGQSSLPVIGGLSESLLPEAPIIPDLADVFSYGEVHTRAEGMIKEQDAVTDVGAAVAAVRVTNQPAPGETESTAPIEFRADTLSLKMRSTHPQEGHPCIEFRERPQFVGLSLGGQPIELQLNDKLMGLSRWKDLDHEFRTNREFFESCPFGQDDRKARVTFGQEVPFVGSFAQCSLVRGIRWGDREIPGHVLAVRGFGAIYFGEILLNDRERRVTMVRMQLGSGNAGQAVFAETDPNGTWWPPRR